MSERFTIYFTGDIGKRLAEDAQRIIEFYGYESDFEYDPAGSQNNPIKIFNPLSQISPILCGINDLKIFFERMEKKQEKEERKKEDESWLKGKSP